MGGLDLAIADVFGATTAWVSDVDPGANKILAHRYPDAPNLGDITRVDWANVEPVDIISGGSPCQDLSHAGRRAGMTEGTRSNLWVSMREAIATIKPSFVVWENVQGALSAEAASELEHCPGCMGDPRHGGPVLRALGRVLGDLADLGFDAEWHGLRVSDLGGCHGRFRVFVLAYAHDAGLQGQPDQAGAAPAGLHGHSVAGAGRPDLTPTSSDANGAGAHGTGGVDLRTTVALLPTPAAGLFNDGESADKWLARRERVKLTARNGNGMGMPLSVAVRLLPTPTTTQRGTDANLDTREGARAPYWGKYAAAIARHEEVFGRPAPEPTELGPHGKPRLSARFVEWMMMLPAGWVTDVPGVTRNQALRALGNGVVPAQAAAALRVMAARVGQ